MLSSIWKFDLSVEPNSAFSNYTTASPGITGMSNLSRSWPTKWKMSKAPRGKGITRKLCKVLRIAQWHHKWILTMIKEAASTWETTDAWRKEASQRQSQLENYWFCYQFQANNRDTSGIRISTSLLRISAAQRQDLRGSLHLQAEIQHWSSRLQHVDPATVWYHLKTAHVAHWWGSRGSLV